MSVASSQSTSATDQTAGPTRPDDVRLLFPLKGIDLDQRIAERQEIERINPHRGAMSLLDALVWVSDDYAKALAVWEVRDDEFWVAGHFPDKPVVPGVLQIEAGAQLACYAFVKPSPPPPPIPAFLRIAEAAFRASVIPGDRLYILMKQIKRGRKRFISNVQGFVRDRIAFEAQISGMISQRTDVE